MTFTLSLPDPSLRSKRLVASLVLAAITLPFLSVSAEKKTKLANQVQESPTQNPTGLKVGVAVEGAGEMPTGTEELARLGALASTNGDWKKAKLIYEDMIAVAPHNPLALSNLAAVEYRIGNLDRAEDLLMSATKIAPGIAQNWITLGLIYHRKDKSDLAISALTRAIHEDPNDPRAHNMLGVVIKERGWAIGAETELQRAITLDPSYADAHFNLAIMYLDKTPPLIELAKRHYYAAIDHGATADETIERRLKGPDSVLTKP